jgi:hypothetical protein
MHAVASGGDDVTRFEPCFEKFISDSSFTVNMTTTRGAAQVTCAWLQAALDVASAPATINSLRRVIDDINNLFNGKNDAATKGEHVFSFGKTVRFAVHYDDVARFEMFVGVYDPEASPLLLPVAMCGYKGLRGSGGVGDLLAHLPPGNTWQTRDEATNILLDTVSPDRRIISDIRDVLAASAMQVSDSVSAQLLHVLQAIESSSLYPVLSKWTALIGKSATQRLVTTVALDRASPRLRSRLKIDSGGVSIADMKTLLAEAVDMHEADWCCDTDDDDVVAAPTEVIRVMPQWEHEHSDGWLPREPSSCWSSVVEQYNQSRQGPDVDE